MKEELKTELITGLLSAPIIYIPHFHYQAIDEALLDIVSPRHGRNVTGLTVKNICEYDLRLGVIDFQTKARNADWSDKLETILENFVCGMRKHLNGCKVLLIKSADKIINAEEVQAQLRLFAQRYERMDKGFDPLCTIILVSPEPVAMLPADMSKLVTVVEVKAPGEQEISAYIEEAGLQVSNAYAQTQKEQVRRNFIRTLQGLQLYEMKQIVRSAVVRTGGFISEKTIALALEEKKSIVKKSGIIEVVDADVSINDVGGLDTLKADLRPKARIFSNLNLAADMGIPLPKGILIVGMPGCGKSMIAKSIASMFGVSLLRLDVNRLMGQYVGQSEQNLRLALATAEAAHPCVLWIDEIEKAFAGTSGHGESDMLVMRLMGHFLTWMQERKTAVYIVATANGVMRPEFMRKGRFDEVYFVDFPSLDERVDILAKKIEKYRQTPHFDFSQMEKNGRLDLNKIYEVAKLMTANKGCTGGFSGSEIECVVTKVMEQKFVEYVEYTEKHHESTQVSITIKDFERSVAEIKDAAMCNQVGKKKEQTNYEKTNIELIREVQATYKFRAASTASPK